MDSVGDMINGQVLDRMTGPYLLPHGSGNPTVKSADPIDMGGKPQGQGGHPKRFVFIPRVNTSVTH